MINQNSIQKVGNSKFTENFIKPLYESYCFSNIPGSIEYLLGSKNELDLPKDVFDELTNDLSEYKKVVLILIDGFGWRFFDKYKNKYPFLKRFVDNGVVSKLTSQFPSTTAAHVTCLNTGEHVGQSGVHEWRYYEPEVDAMFHPLLYKYLRSKESLPEDIDPKKMYPNDNIYKRLKKNNIDSFIFLNDGYIKSQYNQIVAEEGISYGTKTNTDAVISLKNKILEHEGKGYFLTYFDNIDGIDHKYGPDSEHLEAETKTVMYILEEIFWKGLMDSGKFKNNEKDTLVLVTADHGHMKVDPKTTVYINQLWQNKKAVSGKSIEEYIKKTEKGELMVPGGSPRDMFVYIKDEDLNFVKDKLSDWLTGIADVYKTEELIEQGFFGPDVSQKFLNRVGNLVILPYNRQSIWWWEEENDMEMKKYGHHGGLSPEEMEIPFLVMEI